MNPQVERYVRRASRGLWGKRKRIVAEEVRGALEDRIWKHTVAGHSLQEATRRALDDLGDPRLIAGGMVCVHALPIALQLTAMTAIIGVFGFSLLQHSAAQVVAAPYSPALLTCDYSPAGLAKLKMALGTAWTQFKLPPGKTVAEQEAACRNTRLSQYQFLDYDSLLAALKAAGVQITSTLPAGHLTTMIPKLRPYVDRWMSFPDSKLSAPLWGVTVQEQRRLISTAWFIASVAQYGHLPVTVEGQLNPTLHIGKTSLQLGTKDTPVSANDFLSYALYPKISTLVDSVLVDSVLVDSVLAGRGRDTPLMNVLSDPRAPEQLFSYPVKSLKVNLPEQTPVAVLVYLRPDTPPFGPAQALFYTSKVQNGQLLIPTGKAGASLRVTDSLRELLRVFGTNDADQRVMLLKLSQPERLDQLEYDFYAPSVAQP